MRAGERLKNHRSQTHFKDDKVEAQKSEVAYLGSQSVINERVTFLIALLFHLE